MCLCNIFKKAGLQWGFWLKNGKKCKKSADFLHFLPFFNQNSHCSLAFLKIPHLAKKGAYVHDAIFEKSQATMGILIKKWQKMQKIGRFFALFWHFLIKIPIVAWLFSKIASCALLVFSCIAVVLQEYRGYAAKWNKNNTKMQKSADFCIFVLFLFHFPHELGILFVARQKTVVFWWKSA